MKNVMRFSLRLSYRARNESFIVFEWKESMVRQADGGINILWFKKTGKSIFDILYLVLGHMTDM